MSPSRVTAIHPLCAIEGGRLTIEGSEFPVDDPFLPEVRIGDARARIVFASPTRLIVIVPGGLEGGRATVRVGGSALRMTGDAVRAEVRDTGQWSGVLLHYLQFLLVNVSQVATIDKRALLNRIATLSAAKMMLVEEGLRLVLGL